MSTISNPFISSISSSSSSGATSDYIHLREEQSGGSVSADTDTTGGWYTRTLNTKVSDTGGICTLASNQFTLPAGTYYVQASSPFYRLDHFQIRLRQVSGTPATLLTGTSQYSNSSTGSLDRSSMNGQITLTEETTLEIQYQCGNTTGSLGGSNAFMDVAIFTVVELWRIS